MAYFFGFAFIVHLVLAIGRAMVQDRSTVHRREVQRVIGFWSFVWLVLRTWVAKFLHWVAVDYRRRSRTPPAERLQPFGGANPDRPSHLAVFVRGTFGGEGYDKRWDKVVVAVRSVHPRTACFCFYWPGHNSEVSRRAEGAVLAEALGALHAKHPGVAILTIGHSHGGTVIEHASRHLPGEVPLVPILLGAPVLQYTEKLADRLHAPLTALLYASALFFPALALHLAGWVLMLLGYPGLQAWSLEWFNTLGTVVVIGVFALVMPAARRAREVLGVTPPAPRHLMRHIWCRGDEVFGLFAHVDAIRETNDSLRNAWHERVAAVRGEPWLRMLLVEGVVGGLCWAFMAWGVAELARSDPAMLHPLVQQPGAFRDWSVILAAMLLKLLVHYRPRLYHAPAALLSLILFAIHAGLAQICRATLAGLSFAEGVLIEALTRPPMNDGVIQVEVTSSTKPTFAMRLHRLTLGDDAAMQALTRMARAVG